jgi:hypothetical protein
MTVDARGKVRSCATADKSAARVDEVAREIASSWWKAKNKPTRFGVVSGFMFVEWFSTGRETQMYELADHEIRLSTQVAEPAVSTGRASKKSKRGAEKG